VKSSINRKLLPQATQRNTLCCGCYCLAQPSISSFLFGIPFVTLSEVVSLSPPQPARQGACYGAR
jgi:hypothetical protein